MDHLKSVCLKKISQSRDDVCKIVRTAILCNEEELKGAAKEALIQNLRHLKGTEEFEALERDEPQFLNSALMQAMLESEGGRIQ